MLNTRRITLDFFPESCGEIEGVSIISDGELSGSTGGTSKQTNFSFSVGSDTVTKAWKGDVAEDL